MNTKLLIESIGAVVILLLASFTTVVGFASQSSETVKNSPLFEYRTKKAIHETLQSYQYRYISMNNVLNIPLSAPDQKVQLVLRFLQSIVQMDETTFNTLIAYCVTQLNKENKMQHANIAEIIVGLKSIRKNPEYIIDQIVNTTAVFDNTNDIKQQYTIDADWIPGCLLSFIVGVILYVFVVYPLAFIFLFITAMNDCLQSIGTNVNCCPCFRVQVSKYLYDYNIN